MHENAGDLGWDEGAERCRDQDTGSSDLAILKHPHMSIAGGTWINLGHAKNNVRSPCSPHCCNHHFFFAFASQLGPSHLQGKFQAAMPTVQPWSLELSFAEWSVLYLTDIPNCNPSKFGAWKCSNLQEYYSLIYNYSMNVLLYVLSFQKIVCMCFYMYIIYMYIDLIHIPIHTPWGPFWTCRGWLLPQP